MVVVGGEEVVVGGDGLVLGSCCGRVVGAKTVTGWVTGHCDVLTKGSSSSREVFVFADDYYFHMQKSYESARHYAETFLAPS